MNDNLIKLIIEWFEIIIFANYLNKNIKMNNEDSGVRFQTFSQGTDEPPSRLMLERPVSRSVSDFPVHHTILKNTNQ